MTEVPANMAVALSGKEAVTHGLAPYPIPHNKATYACPSNTMSTPWYGQETAYLGQEGAMFLPATVAATH